VGPGLTIALPVVSVQLILGKKERKERHIAKKNIRNMYHTNRPNDEEEKKFLDVEFALDGDVCVHQIFFIRGADVGVRKLVEESERVGVDGVVDDTGGKG